MNVKVMVENFMEDLFWFSALTIGHLIHSFKFERRIYSMKKLKFAEEYKWDSE